MPNVLEVQIIGDVSALEKSLKQAEKLQAEYTSSIEKTSKELADNIAITRNYAKAIDDLSKEYKSGAISSKEYSSSLDKLKRDEKESTVATADLRKELSNLKREQKDLGGSFDSVAKKTANGGNAVMQFTRIIQDAPFGPGAIANNVTAAFESFDHLTRSTGSAGAALKAMAGTLLGGGGVLFAISLVSTGLTYMAQNGLTVGDVFSKLTGTFDEATKAAQELNIEAVKGSQAQISAMNAYVSVATNVNLSMSDRLIAVKKLQDEYPAYFGNLTKEQILNGNVAGAVKEVTNALIAKAKAAAAVDKIVKLAEEESKIQQNINNEIADVARGYQLNKKEAFEFAKAVLQGADAFKLLEPFKKRAGFFDVAEAAALDDTVKKLKISLAANVAQQDKYTKSVNESTAASIKLEAETAKTGKSAKIDLTPKITAIPKLTAIKSTDDQNEKLLKIMRDRLSEDLNKLKTEPIQLNIPLQAVTNGSKFEVYANKLKQAKEDTQIFADGAGAAVSSLAGELASSLQTGNAALDAFVGSVIQGLAEVAAAQLAGLIAKQAVASTSLATDAAVSTGNAVVAATETAASSGPAAAFVLPALVGAAIGFIAAAFSGIKFAHGGVVPGGSFTGDKIPAMLNSGEAVLNSQQQANTLMAIANGNSNSLQGNIKTDNFILESKLRGSDLLLVVKREEKKR